MRPDEISQSINVEIEKRIKGSWVLQEEEEKISKGDPEGADGKAGEKRRAYKKISKRKSKWEVAIGHVQSIGQDGECVGGRKQDLFYFLSSK